MKKNYNDQPDLIDSNIPLTPQVEVEGQVYHKLSNAEYRALQALKNGDLYAKEVRAQQYIESGWDYVQLAQKNGSMYHLSRKVGPKGITLFFYMLDHISKDNNALMVTQTHLSKACGMSLSSVRRAIADLEKNQVLHTVKVGKGTVYVFNAQIAWKGKVKDRPYAFFSANVIADYDEQEDALLKLWRDTSIEGGAPITGKKNAEVITKQLKIKADQKRKDVVIHLISHKIDPFGEMDFEDRKELNQLYGMPMDQNDPTWGPVRDTFMGYKTHAQWAVEFLTLDNNEH